MDQTIPMFGITAGTGDWWIGYGFDKEADANLASDAPRLLAENARLRKALRVARETIKAWHGDGPEWEIYEQHAPEMQTIDSALSAAGEEEAPPDPQQYFPGGIHNT